MITKFARLEFELFTKPSKSDFLRFHHGWHMNTKYEKSGTILSIFFLLSTIITQTANPASGESLTKNAIRFENNIDQVKGEMEPLNFLKSQEYKPSTIGYFQYYGLNLNNVRHFWGSFNSGDKKMAAHIFLPDNPKGTTFVLHGYFDHTGIMKNIIHQCLDLNFAVAVYDLPGHGFSAGERFLINDFSEYVLVLEDFIKICRPHLPEPFHLISHSTGCAIAFEYLSSTKDIIFKKVIFLAPLVHFTSWNMTKVGYFFAKPFVKSLPRKFWENSSDPVFIEKYRNDPLRPESFPLKWLNALYKWDRRIKGYKPVSKPVLVIQGTGDRVVDWKYNIPFLEKKLSKMKVKWIQNARHQLLNESESIKSEVLASVIGYLEE